MWVIKRPIKDLEAKPWPSYDPTSLLEEEGRGTVIYITRAKLNGKEFNHQASLEELYDPSEHNLNPLIYLRLARPLK
jgi:hypothetical protein